MLIIPFDRKLDWKRPPLITFALVLANVLVYVLLQWDDQARAEQAVAYYYDSGLAAIELPRYRDELARRGETKFLATWEDKLDERNSPWLIKLQTDAEFQRVLNAGELLPADLPGYDTWRQQREAFATLWRRITPVSWGFTPAEAAPVTVLSHMFLHGNLAHLLGNMFFLIAVGFLVEGALGRWVYLGSYLVGGLGAVGLFAAFNLGSGVPLVGASGAIAGLMGMYAMLFGRRRVSFFYYVGVYFDYVKAPAFVLLLLWLGYELAQAFWLSPQSNIAYLAHAGGLTTGALLALALQRLPGMVDTGYLDENDRATAERQTRDLSAAHMAKLDYQKAVPLLRELLKDKPADPALLRQLFACVRFRPDSEDYHQTAHQVFRLPVGDAETERLVREVYGDYVGRARPKARWSAAAVTTLAARFTSTGALEEAERLVQVMLRNPAAFPDVAAAVVRLANGLLRRQQAQRARSYFHLILERFPATPEAQVARQALRI